MTVDPQTDNAAPAALTQAAEVAGYAPSIQNTQPWRWRVDGDSMQLYAEPIRQLTASDPGGRLMVLSCGAALHHARIALAAQGWRINVDRLAEPDRPQMLARLSIVGRTEETDAARRLLHAVHMRQTDSRSASATAVEQKDIDTIRAAIEAEKTSLRILHPDAVMEIAAAVAAHRFRQSDPQRPMETAHWAATRRADWLGDPHRSIALEPPRSTATDGGAGYPDDPPMNADNDPGAVYAILFGTDDTPRAWLRGGEAFSAAWLIANALGVSVLPMSGAVEAEVTQRILRRILAGIGEPFLVLRLGVADPDRAESPHTIRLPSRQIIKIIGRYSPTT
jgi:nitroreductase